MKILFTGIGTLFGLFSVYWGLHKLGEIAESIGFLRVLHEPVWVGYPCMGFVVMAHIVVTGLVVYCLGYCFSWLFNKWLEK